MTITTRSAKGSPLTIQEMDENFRALDQRIGWQDFNDSATPITPIPLVANVQTLLTNNGAGPFTRLDKKIPSHGPIWNVATNRFDFTSLSVGDLVEIRFDFIVTTTSPNVEVKTALKLSMGSPSEFDLDVDARNFKAAAPHQIVRFFKIYLDENAQPNPAAIYVTSDNNNASVVVNGWFVTSTLIAL